MDEEQATANNDEEQQSSMEADLLYSICDESNAALPEEKNAITEDFEAQASTAAA